MRPKWSRKIEAKVLAHHGINRDRGGEGKGASSASSAASANGTSNGATVHAFSPQPKPISEKRGR